MTEEDQNTVNLNIHTRTYDTHIEIDTDLGYNIRERLNQYIIRLHDQAVRKALIDAGWTPPKNEELHKDE